MSWTSAAAALSWHKSMFRRDEYRKVTFQGLVKTPLDQTIEGYFEILDAFESHSIIVLNWEQQEVKFTYDRAPVKIRIYREYGVPKEVVQQLLEPFDLLSIRIYTGERA